VYAGIAGLSAKGPIRDDQVFHLSLPRAVLEPLVILVVDDRAAQVEGQGEVLQVKRKERGRRLREHGLQCAEIGRRVDARGGHHDKHRADRHDRDPCAREGPCTPPPQSSRTASGEDDATEDHKSKAEVHTRLPISSSPGAAGQGDDRQSSRTLSRQRA